MISDLRNIWPIIGLSDHTIPKDSHNILIYSYIMGVRYIEKHFTTNKNKKGNDHFHSFNKNDLKIFFKNLDNAKKTLGEKNKTFLKSEIISRKNARRSIFLKKDIKKNTKLKDDDLIMLRPAIGINPFEYKNIVGRRIKRSKKKGDLLKYSDLI